MGKIYCLMGKSSSGKDTIYREVLKKQKDLLHTIVLYTTRPIRDNEQDGMTYHFVSKEMFLKQKNAHKVIEYRTYNTIHGEWIYYTADDGQIDLQKKDYFVIETLEAYLSLYQYFGKEKVVPIYIEIEDGIRLTRALEREKTQEKPKYAEMCRRFLADEQDFSEENLQKAGITNRFWNEDIDKTSDAICSFIKEDGAHSS